jgi:hypothetical protein
MPQLPNISNDVRSSQAVARFCLRLVILSVFASLGSVDFGRSFAVLALMSTVLCLVTGLLRREAVWDSALTHWDEAAAYGALWCLTSAVSQMAV